jgi:hypothetical protein
MQRIMVEIGKRVTEVTEAVLAHMNFNNIV